MAANQLGPGRDEVEIIPAHFKSRAAAGGQFDPFDHGAVVRQQLGLDFTASGELTIEALMAPGLLQQLIAFHRDTGQIRHQLDVAAVALAPAQARLGAKHVQAAAYTAAG